jgi:hypothetical protein
MHDVPPESLIDLEASVRDELEKRLVAQPPTVDLDKLADSVRIEAPARAQAQEREVLQQPWLLD